MKNIISKAGLVAVALAGSIGIAAPAFAQMQVNAVYHVSLTDPATGTAYHVDRKSIRSWSSSENCEAQKETFSGYHTAAVKGFDIKNADGTALEVAITSIDCVVKGSKDN